MKNREKETLKKYMVTLSSRVGFEINGHGHRDSRPHYDYSERDCPYASPHLDSLGPHSDNGYFDMVS